MKKQKPETIAFRSKTALYSEAYIFLEALSEVHGTYGTEHPESIMALGRSSMGKTWLTNFYRKQYPRTQVDGKDIIPILYIRLQATPSSKGLQDILIGELNPFYTKKAAMTSERATQQLLILLRQYGVQMIIIEEIQHFLPGHSEKRVIQHRLDQLKNLIDRSAIPFVLTGQRSAEKILTANYGQKGEDNQLRQRFRSPVFLNSIPHYTDAWKEILSSYQKNMGVKTIDFTSGDLPERFYAATHGHHGKLSKLLSYAIEAWDGKGKIHKEELSKGYFKGISVKPSNACPFTCTDTVLHDMVDFATKENAREEDV